MSALEQNAYTVFDLCMFPPVISPYCKKQNGVGMALKVATPPLILYGKGRAIEQVFASLDIPIPCFITFCSAIPASFSTCTYSTICEWNVVVLDVYMCVFRCC